MSYLGTRYKWIHCPFISFTQNSLGGLCAALSCQYPKEIPMKHRVFSIVIFAVLFCSFSTPIVCASKKLCLPSIKFSKKAPSCSNGFSFLRKALKGAGISLVTPKVQKFLFETRNLHVYARKISLLNKASVKVRCAAFLLFGCKRQGFKYNYRVAFFKPRRGLEVSRRGLQKQVIYKVKFSEAALAAIPKFRAIPKHPGFKKFFKKTTLRNKKKKRRSSRTRRKARCKNHSDCNSGSVLNYMCMQGVCRKTACSQATLIGDRDCPSDLYCAQPNKSMSIYKCMKALMDGSRCGRARMCSAGYCNSQQKCGALSYTFRKKITRKSDSCKTHKDCNSGTILNKICVEGTCQKVNCLAATPIGDKKCPEGFYCSWSGYLKNFKCRRAFRVGSRCNRPRMCSMGHCNSAGICGSGSSNDQSLKISRKKKQEPDSGAFTGVWKNVSMAISVGGGLLVDGKNHNRQTLGLHLGFRLTARNSFIGVHGSFLLGSSDSLPLLHVVLDIGLTFRILNPSVGHGLWIYTSYLYWGRGIKSATYHESYRHGAIVDARYELPIGRWLGDPRHFLHVSTGIGLAERVLTPYDKMVVVHTRLQIGYTFLF